MTYCLIWTKKMTKIPRKRRRELRCKVSAVIAEKLKLVNLEGFTEPLSQEELDYARGFLDATRLSFETRASMIFAGEEDDQI